MFSDLGEVTDRCSSPLIMAEIAVGDIVCIPYHGSTKRKIDDDFWIGEVAEIKKKRRTTLVLRSNDEKWSGGVCYEEQRITVFPRGQNAPNPPTWEVDSSEVVKTRVVFNSGVDVYITSPTHDAIQDIRDEVGFRIFVPPKYNSTTDKDLFNDYLEKCISSGETCEESILACVLDTASLNSTRRILKHFPNAEIFIPSLFDPTIQKTIQAYEPCSLLTEKVTLGKWLRTSRKLINIKEGLKIIVADYCSTYLGNKLIRPDDDLRTIFLPGEKCLLARGGILALTFSTRTPLDKEDRYQCSLEGVKERITLLTKKVGVTLRLMETYQKNGKIFSLFYKRE